MKQVTLFILTGLALCMLQACSSSASDTKSIDSANAARALAAKNDSLVKMPGTPDVGDIQFVISAAQNELAQNALCKLASDESVLWKIKEYCETVTDFNTQAEDRLGVLARAKNIMLPTEPDTLQQDIVTALSKKTEDDFDMTYADQMIIYNTKAIALFEDEQNSTKDVDLKAFIAKVLPTLRVYLAGIKEIKEEMIKP